MLILWKRLPEQLSVLSVIWSPRVRYALSESRSLGMERKAGGTLHLKLDICVGLVVNKHHDGKMQRIFNREFKVLEIAGREVSRTSFACEIGAWRWHSSHCLRRCLPCLSEPVQL